MEREEANAIAISLAETLKYFPFETPILNISMLERTLQLTFVPLESSRMQFEVDPFLSENSERINSQYSPDLQMELIIYRVLTNFKTTYSPSMFVREVRKIKEKSHEREGYKFNPEVTGRAARDSPQIFGLMKRSYEKYGNRYSALAVLKTMACSETQDHELWVNCPIIAVPSIVKPVNLEPIDKLDEHKIDEIRKNNRRTLTPILNFAQRYQKPSKGYLNNGEYKLKVKTLLL